MDLIDKLVLLARSLVMATFAVTAALLTVWTTWFVLWMIGNLVGPPGS